MFAGRPLLKFSHSIGRRSRTRVSAGISSAASTLATFSSLIHNRADVDAGSPEPLKPGEPGRPAGKSTLIQGSHIQKCIPTLSVSFPVNSAAFSPAGRPHDEQRRSEAADLSRTAEKHVSHTSRSCHVESHTLRPSLPAVRWEHTDIVSSRVLALSITAAARGPTPGRSSGSGVQSVPLIHQADSTDAVATRPVCDTGASKVMRRSPPRHRTGPVRRSTNRTTNHVPAHPRERLATQLGLPGCPAGES